MKPYKCQLKHSDCGLVVFENAAIWADSKISKKTQKFLKMALDYHEDIGVNPNKFEDLIFKLEEYETHQKYDFGFCVVDTVPIPSIDELREYVNTGHAIILCVDYGDQAHVGLLVNMTKHYATVVNWGKNKPVRKISVKKLTRWLDNWSIGYVIEKFN